MIYIGYPLLGVSSVSAFRMHARHPSCATSISIMRFFSKKKPFNHVAKVGHVVEQELVAIQVKFRYSTTFGCVLNIMKKRVLLCVEEARSSL